MRSIKKSSTTSPVSAQVRVISWEEEVRQWKSRQEVADGLPLLLQVHCGELDRNRFACKCCEPFNSLIGFQDFEPIVDTMWKYICLEESKQKLHLAELIKEALLHKKKSSSSSFVRFLLPISTSGHRVCFAKFSALSLFPLEYMKQLLDQNKRCPAPVCDESPRKRLKLNAHSTPHQLNDGTKSHNRKRQVSQKTTPAATVSPEKTSVMNELAVGSVRKTKRPAKTSQPCQDKIPVISSRRSPQRSAQSPERKLRPGRKRACWLIQEASVNEHPAITRSPKPPTEEVQKIATRDRSTVDSANEDDSDCGSNYISKNIQQGPPKRSPPPRIRGGKCRSTNTGRTSTDDKSETRLSAERERRPQPLEDSPPQHNTAKRKLSYSQKETTDEVLIQRDEMVDSSNQNDIDSEGSAKNLQEAPTEIPPQELSRARSSKHKLTPCNKDGDSNDEMSKMGPPQEWESRSLSLLEETRTPDTTAKLMPSSSQNEYGSGAFFRREDVVDLFQVDLSSQNNYDYSSDGSPKNLQDAKTTLSPPEPPSVRCNKFKPTPCNKAGDLSNEESSMRLPHEQEPCPQPLLQETPAPHNAAELNPSSSQNESTSDYLILRDDMVDLTNQNDSDSDSDNDYSPNDLQDARTMITLPDRSSFRLNKYKPTHYDKAGDSEGEESSMRLPHEQKPCPQPLEETHIPHNGANLKPSSSLKESASKVLILSKDIVDLSNQNDSDSDNDDGVCNPKNLQEAPTKTTPPELSSVRFSKYKPASCNKAGYLQDEESKKRPSHAKKQCLHPLLVDPPVTHNTAGQKVSSSRKEGFNEILWKNSSSRDGVLEEGKSESLHAKSVRHPEPVSNSTKPRPLVVLAEGKSVRVRKEVWSESDEETEESCLAQQLRLAAETQKQVAADAGPTDSEPEVSVEGKSEKIPVVQLQSSPGTQKGPKFADNRSASPLEPTDSETRTVVEGRSGRVPEVESETVPGTPDGQRAVAVRATIAVVVALNNAPGEADDEETTTQSHDAMSVKCKGAQNELKFDRETHLQSLSATEVQGSTVQRRGSTASSDVCPATVSPDHSCDDRVQLQTARSLQTPTNPTTNNRITVSEKPIPRLVHATRKPDTIRHSVDVGEGTGTSRPTYYQPRKEIGLVKLGQQQAPDTANPNRALLSTTKRQPTVHGAKAKHAPVATKRGSSGHGEDLEILSLGSNCAEKEETVSTHPSVSASYPQSDTIVSSKRLSREPKGPPETIIRVPSSGDFSSGDEYFSENWTQRTTRDPDSLRTSQSKSLTTSNAKPENSRPRKPAKRKPNATSPQAFFGNTHCATVGLNGKEDESETSSDDSLWEDAYAFAEAKQAECTVEDFCQIWESVEKDWGERTKDIENGKLIRAANHRKSSQDQVSAQYGRITFFATAKLFEELDLNPSSDIFVDFGHGVGNAVVQAAFTIGCRARGIEVDPDRYKISQIFHQCFLDAYIRLWHDRDGVSFNPGNIDLKCGQLEDTAHEEFLTTGGCIKAFCNNFNGVFGRKCVRVGRPHSLDDNLAGLFGLMPTGSVLITFSKLDFLVPPGSQISNMRQAAGLPEVECAGFYEEEEIWLGSMKDSVSWAAAHNTKDLQAFKYTLTNNGFFLCWNPRCENARKGEMLSASRFVEKGQYWVPNSCQCGANSGMSLRQRRRQRK